MPQLRYPMVQDFLMYVRDRLMINFKPLDAPKVPLPLTHTPMILIQDETS